MFIDIVENRNNESVYFRRLAPNESVDPAYHARQWANREGFEIAKQNGHIPRGCADFYAEVRRTKAANGSCWDSYDFYLSGEDE